MPFSHHRAMNAAVDSIAPRRQGRFVALLGCLAGLGAGIAVGIIPALVVAGVGLLGVILALMTHFEATVLALFVLRSGMDLFSAYQLPVAFALGIDGLAIAYGLLRLLARRPIHLDGFWLFFALWTGLQGLWVALMAIGAFGMDPGLLPGAVREWVRLGSWLLAYLLILQFKDRFPPERVLGILLLALVIPLGAATLQVLLPPHLLPSFLVFDSGGHFASNVRISGSLGHPNTFGVYLVFFLGLAYWRLLHAEQRWRWVLLLGVLAFFIVSSKALGALVMFMTFIVLVTLPRLTPMRLLGSLLLIAIGLALFAGTEFGQARLASIYATPLLNPDIDWSRSVLLSWSDGNSFNWRIAQWTFLLTAWQEAPLWGHGLNTSDTLTVLANYAHNEYVRALAEGGVIGLGLFLLFLLGQGIWLAWMVSQSPSHHPRRTLAQILLAFLGATVVGMATENIWTHTNLYYYWWVVFAVLSWPWQRDLAGSPGPDDHRSMANHPMLRSENSALLGR